MNIEHNKKTTRRGFIKTSLAISAGLSSISVASAARGAETQPAGKIDENRASGRPAEAGDMPYGTIGDIKVSRLILGCNVMTKYAHARDLAYVSKLMEAYNTEERVLNVLKTAESQGINTIMQGNPLVKKYNMEQGGHMRQIRSLQIGEEDNEEKIKRKISALAEQGERLIYVFGCSADILVRDGKVDVIGTALALAKEAGVICGVGCHSLKVVTECEKRGFEPAFYFKTFHNDQYWSATPKERREDFCWYGPGGSATDPYFGNKNDHNEYNDNMWCLEPEETIEVMKNVKVPWIAFKVLAAGAISPTSGFKFALENGADFMAVGMLDFQIKEDVQILQGLFARGIKRERSWRG